MQLGRTMYFRERQKYALFSGIYAHILTCTSNLRSVKNAAASFLASLSIRRLFSTYLYQSY